MNDAAKQAEEKPSLREDGSLRIPLDSDPKYQHWKPGGQSVYLTLAELNAPAKTFILMGTKEKGNGDVCRCEKKGARVENIYYCPSCLFWCEADL